AIPNGGGGCIEHFYEDTPEGRVSAEAFARQYDKPGMGGYDCVSPLRDRRRTKDNVAQIDGLHVDIDAYKLKKTKDEVVTALRDEFSALGILSRLNSSGRGIHAHFFFREPIEAGTPEAAQAQQILKRLVAHLGADPQPAHFAALMRRVGTTNSKEGGGPCETLLDTGAKGELADIEGYLELVEGREELFPRPEPKTNCGDAQHKGPVDVEVELASMVPGDESGRGVNATQVRVITSLIWRALHPAEICKKVVDATMEMAERRGLTWNRHEEETDIAKRTLCQYRTAFENEYDPATGIIPVWLPMEFHAQWAAILANGGHPTMDKRRFWYVGRTDKKTNGEKTNGGAEDNNSLMHEEATPGDGPTAPFILRPLEPFDPAALPCREFLLGKHYQRRVVSGTVAPGGTGKSSKVMSEGISMATARDLLDEQPRERLRVWLHNGEGNMDELRRRLAGNCQHHGIPLEELRGWFFMTSGNEVPLRVAQSFNQVRMQTDNR